MVDSEFSINKIPVNEELYSSEKNAPSAKLVPQKDQYSPRVLIGPFPLQPYEAPPEVGSEEAANGSNPPALPCATEGYSRSYPGDAPDTQLSKPANTSSAAVSSFLSGGR